MARGAKTRHLDSGDAAGDRISNLSINFLHEILAWLPLHDAARTSILSKKWRLIWVKHSYLHFEKEFFSQFLSKKDKRTQVSEVSRTISNILLLHNGPISVFKLWIPPYLPLQQCLEADYWIKNISNNGVRVFELLNKQQVAYKMPSYLFSCLELTYLGLKNCILNPPREFGGFCNLTDVRLKKVIITADMSFGTQLKELLLENCTGIEHLGSHFKYNNNLCSLKIVNSGELDWRLFECNQKVHLLTLQLEGVTNSRNEIISLDKLLGNMPKINALFLDDCFLQSLEPGVAVLKRLITTLEELYLYLYDLVHIQYVLCLIRSSPNLRCLWIRLEEPKEISIDDMGLLDLLSVELVLDQLETVEIFGMVGSKAEFQFIKLLLASTPSLRCIKLEKSITVEDPKEELRISRELLQIPRASTSSRIIWM